MKVLVVDPKPSMRQLISSMLRTDQTEVIETADSSDLFGLCSQLRPDWVLMDLQAAGGDAYSTAQILKRNHPDTHVTILTNQENETLRRMAGDAGAGTVLLKDNLFAVLVGREALPEARQIPSARERG